MTAEEIIQLIKEKQTAFAGLTYTQIQDILDQFSSEDGAKKAILDFIETARSQFALVEQELDRLKSIGGIPEAALIEARAAVAEAKVEFEEARAAFKDELDALISSAVEQATAAKVQLENLLDAKVDAFKISIESIELNLSSAEQEVLQGLIEKYFPTEA